jgi:hypothetical protein
MKTLEEYRELVGEDAEMYMRTLKALCGLSAGSWSLAEEDGELTLDHAFEGVRVQYLGCLKPGEYSDDLAKQAQDLAELARKVAEAGF